MPAVVFVLALCTFVLGTSEFVVAGLLPGIAADLGVSVAQAGLAVTVFAAGMVVGAPVMVALTLRVPRRTTLVLALLVFSASHLLAAVTSNFAVLLSARFVSAVVTGAFWSVGMAVATRAAGPASSARALGVVVGGGTLANVAGVPLGAFLGQVAGWRGPFWVLTALSAAAALVILRQVPADHADSGHSSLRGEVAGLRSGRLWLAYAACAGTMGGVLAAFTFVAPLLTVRAGLDAGLVPVVLVVFGFGSLLGVALGGRLGDAHPYFTTIIAASITTLSLAGLAVLADRAWPAVVLISLAGLTGFSVNPVTISLAVSFAPSAPTLATTVASSSFNAGIVASSALAGIALESPLGLQGPPAVGAVFGVLTVAPLVALALIARRRPGARVDEPSLIAAGAR